MQAGSYNLKHFIILRRKKRLMINFDFQPQNETVESHFKYASHSRKQNKPTK